MRQSSWVDKDSAVVALIFVLVAASYLTSLFNPFMWDDKQLVVTNVGLHQGWTSVASAFSPASWAGRADDAGLISFFRPTQSLLTILDYEVWGLNPFGFHLSNTILHLFNAVFLFFLSARVTGDRLASFAAAAVFAVHPVHTESVTFISARVDLLAAAFMLPSLYLYIGSRRLVSWGYLLSLILFWLALFSKEMAVTLPALVALYSFVFEEKGGRAAKAAPFFVLLGLYVAYRVFGLEVFVTQHKMRADVLTLASTAAAAVFDYIRLLIVPYPLKAYYLLEWYGPLHWKAIAGLVLLVLSAVLCVFLYLGRRPSAAFFLAWTFVALAPVMNIGSLGEFSIAERYLYIPSVGFSVLVGLVFAAATGKRSAKVPLMVLAAALVVLGAMTVKRNALWSNDLDFFTEMVRVAPTSPAAHGNLAHAHLNLGDIDGAIREMETASAMVPGNPALKRELGTYYFKAGQFEKAAVVLALAVEGRPDDAEAWNLLGVSYAETGRAAEAAEAFRMAIGINPASQAVDNLRRLMGE